MPTNNRDLEAQLQDEDAQTAQSRAGALATEIPAAREPLQMKTLELVRGVLQQAVPLLSGGQVPDLQIPDMPDKSPSVPPELGIPLMTVARFFQQAQKDIPALKDYAFDPLNAMATNQGLVDAAHRIAGAMEDQNVIGALSAPPASVRSGQAGAEQAPPTTGQEA